MAKSKANKVLTPEYYPVSREEFQYVINRLDDLQKKIMDLKEFQRKIQIDVSSWPLYGN